MTFRIILLTKHRSGNRFTNRFILGRTFRILLMFPRRGPTPRLQGLKLHTALVEYCCDAHLRMTTYVAPDPFWEDVVEKTLTPISLPSPSLDGVNGTSSVIVSEVHENVLAPDVIDHCVRPHHCFIICGALKCPLPFLTWSTT